MAAAEADEGESRLRLALSGYPAWWRELERRPGGYKVTGGAPGRRATIGVDLPLSGALRSLCGSCWSSGDRLWTVTSGPSRSWRCVEAVLGEVVLSREGGRWAFSAAGSTSTVDPALEGHPFPTLLRGWVTSAPDAPPDLVEAVGAERSPRTLQGTLPLARLGRWESVETWLDLPRRAFRVGDRWGRAATEFGALRGWLRAAAPWLGDPFALLPDRRFTNAGVRAAEAHLTGVQARVTLPDGRALELRGAAPVGSEGLFTALVVVDGEPRRALGEGPCGAVLEALRAVDPRGPPLWTGASG